MYSPIISTNPKIMSDEIQRLKDQNVTIDTSINNIQETASIMGAKNRIQYPYNESSHTEADVVWTVYDDGSVKANGKANGAYSSLVIAPRGTNKRKMLEKGKTYILTGCPQGGSASKYSIRYYAEDSSNNVIVNGGDNGEGFKFTIPADSSYDHDNLFIRIYENYTADNLMFYPMIRLASDEDETFEPYSKTNQELTSDVAALNSDLRCSETTAGTYKLQATVDAQGAITYEWVEVV